MEHEMITALAVGGPAHGRWLTAVRNRAVMVPRERPPGPASWLFTEEPDLTMETPHIYHPQRWKGSSWTVTLPFWIWDGYPLLGDGTPEVPASDMPPYARTGVWPEVCILCEICYRRAMNLGRALGVFRCDDHWPEVYR